VDLIGLLVFLAVAVIVISVAWWLLSQVSLDPQIRRIITIVMVVVVAIIGIIILLKFAGYGTGPYLRVG
jgi:hypothetical protein